MPTKPADILAQLRHKRHDFQRFDRTALDRLQQYRRALSKAARQSTIALEQALPATINRPGAYPLEPNHDAPNWVIAANLVWQNREQSLAWVRDHLTGVATFAVDGSQIFPSKDISIPIALVQVGWFENHHLPSGSYRKDIAVEVMTPVTLKRGDGGEAWERRVNLRRFQMEIDQLIEYMQEHADREDCLVFFDGALVATYAEVYDVDSRARYVEYLLKLLQASEHYRVPLVAYIDNSQAADLVLLLQECFQLPDAHALSDAQLLNPLMQWGDRTPLFLCQRPGILSDYRDHADKVTFTYLKTTCQGYPARLEIPLWVYEAGWLDRILGWVRGEVIIGGGYPYAIETADQVAVLQADDRQMFYRILQDWAEQEKLDLRFSRKLVSKVRRRL